MPLAWAVQTANQIHQCRFAGAGRAHDRHVLATVNLNADPGNGVDFLVAHYVRFPEIVRPYNDAIALQLFAALIQFLDSSCHS
jgi:hypothetical protein